MKTIIQKNFSVVMMSAIMFVTLITLGLWQWQRMAWKADILNLIDSNEVAAPISLVDVLEKSKAKIGSVNKAEYSRVALSGVYHHNKTRHFFAQRMGQAGWVLYTPFEYKEGYFVFVNRGFMPAKFRPEKLGNAPAQIVAKPEGKQTITGLFRMGLKKKASRFILENAIDKNEYFWRSIEDMTKGAFKGEGIVLPLSKATNSEAQSKNQTGDKLFILPFSLDLEKNDHDKEWPKAGTTILKPANNHFTYMMTWFSFALTLLIITGFFLAGDRRKG